MSNIIGLLDYDLLQSESITRIVPNLEIMKLATYYRVEKNHFCRLLSLDEEDLESYEKIYFFSETGRKLLIPTQFKRANNVIYGGSAFTNFKYVPFENKVIDYTIPRIAIYQEYLKQKYQAGFKNIVISHALDDTYYRMYAGDKLLPIPAIKAKQRVYLFDRDFFYSNWEDLIKEITDRKPSGIHRIHPIVCHTLSNFFTARQYTKLVRDSNYILDLKVPLDEVGYMIGHYKNQFLAEIVKTSNVFLPLKSDLPTASPYYRNLVYTLNVLYAFWAKNIPIKLYIEETPTGVTNNPIAELEQAIAVWAGATLRIANKLDRTILQRIGKNKVLLAQYESVINKIPQAKTLFNQSYADLIKRGYWRL